MDVLGVGSTVIGMLALVFTNRALASVPQDKIVETMLSVPAHNWTVGYSTLGVVGLFAFGWGVMRLVKDVGWELESGSMTLPGAVAWGLTLFGLIAMALYLFPWRWYITMLVVGVLFASAVLALLSRKTGEGVTRA